MIEKTVTVNHLKDTLLRKDLGLTPKQALHKLLVTAFRANYDELAANGSKMIVATNAIYELRTKAETSSVLYDEHKYAFMTEKRINADGLYIHKVLNLWTSASPSTVDNMLRKAWKDISND